eukprot:COSAG02_NODE_43137_length_377_cov_1.593525_1_plen_66_part_00
MSMSMSRVLSRWHISILESCAESGDITINDEGNHTFPRNRSAQAPGAAVQCRESLVCITRKEAAA